MVFSVFGLIISILSYDLNIDQELEMVRDAKSKIKRNFNVVVNFESLTQSDPGQIFPRWPELFQYNL